MSNPINIKQSLFELTIWSFLKKESFHCGLPFNVSKDKCSHQKSIRLTSNFNGVHKKSASHTILSNHRMKNGLDWFASFSIGFCYENFLIVCIFSSII